MALQGTGSPAMYPTNLGVWYGGTLQLNAGTMDASNEGVAFIMQVPKDGDIHKVLFRTGTVSASDPLKVGIFNLASTGLPDTASAYKSMTVGTVDPVASTTAYTVTLGADAVSAVKGDWIAVVIEFNSFTSGNVQIALVGSGGTVQGHVPYTATSPGGVWGKTASMPICALEYSDGTYGFQPGIAPWVSGLATTAFAQDTAVADEYALKFQVPFPTRIVGFSGFFNTNEDHSFFLYDSDGTTVLESITTHLATYVVSDTNRYCEFLFDTPVTLSANTNYYLSMRSTENSNTVSVLIGSVPTAAALDAHGGQNFHLATQVNVGGTWTPTTTSQPLISLMLDQFSDGVSSGGAVSYGFAS